MSFEIELRGREREELIVEEKQTTLMNRADSPLFLFRLSLVARATDAYRREEKRMSVIKKKKNLSIG